MINAISAPFEQINFLPTGGINESNLIEYLSSDRVVACGGSWMVPSKAVKKKDWGIIEDLTKTAVNLLLGFELSRVDIYSGDNLEEDAIRLAKMFGALVKPSVSSYNIGPIFELITKERSEEQGIISIACNSVDRAIWHLEQRGFVFEKSSLVKKNKSTQQIDLREKYSGFRFRLILK